MVSELGIPYRVVVSLVIRPQQLEPDSFSKSSSEGSIRYSNANLYLHIPSTISASVPMVKVASLPTAKVESIANEASWWWSSIVGSRNGLSELMVFILTR